MDTPNVPVMVGVSNQGQAQPMASALGECCASPVVGSGFRVLAAGFYRGGDGAANWLLGCTITKNGTGDYTINLPAPVNVIADKIGIFCQATANGPSIVASFPADPTSTIQIIGVNTSGAAANVDFIFTVVTFATT